MSDTPSRRDILQLTGTAITVSIIPVSETVAVETEENPGAIQIHNNSDKKEQIDISLLSPSIQSDSIYSASYILQGLNNPARNGTEDTKFVGRIRADRRGIVTLRVEVGERNVERKIDVTPEGLYNDELVSVYINPDGSLTVNQKWR